MSIVAGQPATAQDINDALNAKISIASAGDIAITATGGTVNAALSQRFSRRLNVIDDFGAKGDGITDDTANIQAAFNQAGTTGGTVYFPKGTGDFCISSTITAMAQVALGVAPSDSEVHFAKHNVINVESDAGAVIKATAAMNSMIVFKSNSLLSDIGPFYSTVHGITLNGNSNATVGILSNYTMHMDIQHNAFHGCTGPAIELIGYGVARIAHNVFKGPIGVQFGISATPGGGDSMILHNDFYPDNASGTCQAVNMGPWSGDTTITGNVVTRVQTAGTGTCYGVRLSGDQASDSSHEVRHVIITANEFWQVDAAVYGRSFSGSQNVWQNAISKNHVYDTYGVLADLNNCDDFIVTDNFCNGKHLNVAAGPAITLASCSRIRIGGNIAGNYTAGFLVGTDMVDCEITGNIIQDVGQSGTSAAVIGLSESSTCVRNVVRGNHIYQSSSSYAQNGVVENTGVDQTMAQDNFMSGLSNPYTKVGTNSVMRRVEFASAVPTTGTYNVGDLTYSTAPTAGGTIAWICTTGGTPGTWAAFGQSSTSSSGMLVDSVSAGDLYGTTALFNPISTTNSLMMYGIFRNNNPGPYIDLIHQRDSSGNPAVNVSGDVIGAWRFQGYDSAANRVAAQIQAVADGTPSSGSMPGRLSMWTVPSGSVTLIERLRVSQDGTVSANANAPIATTATGGFFAIPTCAGTPTGTPANAVGASVVFDTTNNKFWAYNGSAWKGVALT